MKRNILLVILIVLAAVLTVGFLSFFNKKESKQKEREIIQETKVYKIYLPFSETRQIEIKKESSDIKDLERLIQSFTAQLPSPLNQTQIFGVYRDRENKVYISLSSSFASPQSAKEEYFILKSFYQTITENFQWVRDVKILINDEEVETLAGHILIKDSLKDLEDK